MMNTLSDHILLVSMLVIRKSKFTIIVHLCLHEELQEDDKRSQVILPCIDFTNCVSKTLAIAAEDIVPPEEMITAFMHILICTYI